MTWVVLGDSVAGTSHQTQNTPCQDAYRVRTYGEGAEWLMVAAADGAGSASFARIGATLACDEFARRLGREHDTLFTRDGMTALFGDVRTALLTEAERLDVRPRELACTALVAVAGPETAAFAQLGDGAIIIGDGPGHRAVFWPDPTGYANATDFLTDERFADALRFEVTSRPIVELAVLSDGLQRLALDFSARAPHAEFFRPLFDELLAAADPGALADPFRAFLDSPRVNARTDDDKTLVLAARRP